MVYCLLIVHHHNKYGYESYDRYPCKCGLVCRWSTRLAGSIVTLEVIWLALFTQKSLVSDLASVIGFALCLTSEIITLDKGVLVYSLVAL